MNERIYCSSDATEMVWKLSLILDDIESFSYSNPKQQLTIKRKNKKPVVFHTLSDFHNYQEEIKKLKREGLL